MDFLALVSQNILSPAVLFFALGLCAGLIKSDLEVPDSISRYLSLYLMMAIGFHGGVALISTPSFSGQLFGAIFTGLGFSLLMPFLAYGLLRATTMLDKPTLAAIAAHYGSISIVTFGTAASFLKVQNTGYAGYMAAVLALMEAPAIFSGLFIAHHTAPETRTHKSEERRLMTHDIFTNGAILLLFGAFLIGAITGRHGMELVGGFLETPYQGILCLFLLDMGLLVTKNLHQLRQFSFALIAFGLYMPLLGAALGLLSAYALHLDVGTGMLLMVLCASASYIAVPAAMRLALPEAKATIYVPMSLAVTFPFNIALGIPLYYLLATLVLG